MLIIRLQAAKDIVLTNRETGQEIRLSKVHSQLGIEAPANWQIKSVKRPEHD